MKTAVKRISALMLAVMLILPLCVFSPVIGADDKTVTWGSPAIPCDVGETVDLTAYKVAFSSDEVFVKVTWSENGKEITSFKADKAGVYVITASDGSKTRDVYVVAKNANDKEYVIYYNDFSKEDSISDWNVPTTMKNRVSVVDGKLIIDGTDVDLARVNMPSWLKCFGDASITASVATSEERDTGRWNSIVFRSTGLSYPFYHMCVRKNASASNGVEFAIRNPSNAWDVRSTGSFTENKPSNSFYTYNLQFKGDTVLESINGKGIILNSEKKAYRVGDMGFITNFSKMHIDYVKITLQLTTPEIKVVPDLTITGATVENITNTLTNVAEITDKAQLSSLENASSVILYTDGTNITSPDGKTVFASIDDTYTLIGEKIVPIFSIKDKAAAVGVQAFANKQSPNDIGVMSAVPTVVKYARGLVQKAFGIVDFRDAFSGVLNHTDVIAIRKAVNGNNCKIALLDEFVTDRASCKELKELLITPWLYSDCSSKAIAAKTILKGAYGVVSPNPNVVKESFGLFESNTLSRTPLIIGHRGNPTNAPENSISSYLSAYEYGADIVETDVYLSADGEIVIMHDNDISRTTTGVGNIESMTVEQLKKYNLWADNKNFENKFPNEKIPTLREMFEFAKDKDVLIFVEIKSAKTAICKKIADLAKEMNMTDRIVVISFSMDQCIAMHNADPQISCGYLCSVGATGNNLLAHNALSSLRNSTLPNNTTINPSYGSVNKDFLNAANNRGITVWTWTYGTSLSSVFAEGFKNGVPGLTTNDAQYTKSTIRSIDAEISNTVIPVGAEADYKVTSLTYNKTVADITDKATPVVISGNDVISVENGRIKALKSGTAYVTFSRLCDMPTRMTKDKYTLYTDVIEITVKAAEDTSLLTLVNGSPLKIKNGFVTNVALGITAEKLISNFANTSVSVIGVDGKEMPEDTVVSTGATVKSGNNTSKIVVTGDLDGNGIIDEKDVKLLGDVIARKVTEGPAFEAGKTVGDETPNVTDYISLKLKVKGK